MDKQCRSETSSRLVTKSVQAAHNFEVTDFSLLDGMGAGKFVTSRNFSAGGRHWNIKLYPDGFEKGDKGAYVSVFLCFISGAENPRTQYSFSVLDKDGKSRGHSSMVSRTFKSPVDSWGYTQFIDKSQMKSLLGLSSNHFTIRCALTVIGQSEFQDDVVVVPPSNMQQHFEYMLKDGKGKDVTFDVDGRLFDAHRCVLAARSPVFEAELFGPMKEKDNSEPIKVDDMEPCIFEELLHFIYTDRVSGTCDGDENVATQHLLVAADRYGLDRLRLMCEVRLCDGIDAQTVASTLALADQHHCTHLKDACLRFVTSGDVLGLVILTDGFKHLVASCPLVMLEISDKIAEAKKLELP